MIRFELVTAPASEPVTASDLRAWARLDDNGDDAFLSALITSARCWVEFQTGRALLTQTWRALLPAWPDTGRDGWRRVRLTPKPKTVSSVTVDGAAVSSTLFAVVGDDLLVDPAAASPGATLTAGVAITFTAGEATAAAVARPLRDAIMLIAGAQYDDRQAAPPAAAGALIAPYQVIRSPLL